MKFSFDYLLQLILLIYFGLIYYKINFTKPQFFALLFFLIIHKLSEDKRNNIITALQSDLSSKEVAERYRVSKSTVNSIHSKYVSTIPRSSGGCSVSLPLQDKSSCVRSVTLGKFKTAINTTLELNNKLGIMVSERTG